MLQAKCPKCQNAFSVDENVLDVMRIVTCPNCSDSFQLSKSETSSLQGGSPVKKGGSDFEDFFEVDENERDISKEAVKTDKAEKAPPLKQSAEEDRGEAFTASAADFLQDAFDQNVGREELKKDQQIAHPAKKEELFSDDEVFGDLEGFEEFLSVGDETSQKSQPKVQVKQPLPPQPEMPKEKITIPPPVSKKPAEPTPPKKSHFDVQKPQKDMIDESFEELFAEPSKEPPRKEAPQKAHPYIETNVKAASEKIKEKGAPPPPSTKVDTVSDEAFEALFHDIKGAEAPSVPVGAEGEVQESGLGIDFPKKKIKFNFKLALFIVVPLIIVSVFSYFLIFTKEGILGLSFYSYFIEGYRKPKPAVMKVLNEKFADIKKKLSKDFYPDYNSSIRELKDILAQDPRFIPAHAYLVLALLFSSGDPLNQSTRKEIETFLAQSEQLNPALNEGVIARAFYAYRSGNLADAEKLVRRLLDSGSKDPLVFEIMGDIYFSRGNYPEARKNFEEASNLDKDNLRVKHSLSMAMYGEGKAEEAVSILDTLRKEPFTHLSSAIDWNYIQWTNFGKTDESKSSFIEIFEKFSEKLGDFDYARLSGYIGDILYKEGTLDQASLVLEKGLKREPFNHSIAFRTGLILLDQGKSEKAIPYFKKAISIAPRETYYYIPYAKALREQKEVEQSLIEIGKALEIDPNNIDALYQKGLSEKEADKLQEALVSFERVREISPKHIEALIESGDINIKQGNFKEASDLFKKAAFINSKVARTHSGLGTAYLGLGKMQDALSEFEIAEKLSPNNVMIILNIGKSLLDMNKLADAKLNFERAIKLDPNKAEAYTGIGDIHFKKQEYAEADSVYKEALKISPRDVELKVKLARTDIELKQFKPALGQLLEVSKISIDYFPAYLQLGIVYRNLGSMDDSLRELEKSITLRPDSSEAHYEYGITLMLNAQVSTGLPHIFKAIELDTKNVKAYERLVDFYSETNNFPKAVEYSKKILEVNPKRWKSRLKLAECYRKMNKDKEAYQTYLDVIKQNKSIPQAYLGAGEILEESKQYGAALKFYSLARRVDSKNPVVYYHLGFLYKYMNDKDNAVQAFRKFLSLNPDNPETEDIKDEIDYLMK